MGGPGGSVALDVFWWPTGDLIGCADCVKHCFDSSCPHSTFSHRTIEVKLWEVLFGWLHILWQLFCGSQFVDVSTKLCQNFIDGSSKMLGTPGLEGHIFNSCILRAILVGRNQSSVGLVHCIREERCHSENDQCFPCQNPNWVPSQLHRLPWKSLLEDYTLAKDTEAGAKWKIDNVVVRYLTLLLSLHFFWLSVMPQAKVHCSGSLPSFPMSQPSLHLI